LGCVTSCTTWDEWVIEQRGDCSARLKSAHLTNGNGSTSLGGFPTPTVSDSCNTSRQNWPTPQASEIENTNKEYRSPTNAYRGEKKVQPMLADACKKNWPTPRVSDDQGASSTRIGQPNAQLREKVLESWPTPTVAEGEKIPNRANYGQVCLSNHPAIVGKPNRPKQQKDGRQDLDKSSTRGKNPEQWPTPRAGETDENLETWEKRRQRKEKEGINLHKPLSVKVRQEVKPVANQQLNPSWVEQLMLGIHGVGWTQLPTEWTDSGCLATE